MDQELIDTVLETVKGEDPEAFSRAAAEAARGTYTERGRTYPALIGQSHTARIFYGRAR